MAGIKRKVLIPVDGSENSQKAFDCKYQKKIVLMFFSLAHHGFIPL